MTDQLEKDCPFCGETVGSLPHHLGDCEEAPREVDDNDPADDDHVEVRFITE